jgi:hypothetical protein
MPTATRWYDGAVASTGGGPQRPHSAQPPQQFSVPQSAAAVQEEEFVPLLQVSARKDSRLRQMRFKGGTIRFPVLVSSRLRSRRQNVSPTNESLTHLFCWFHIFAHHLRFSFQINGFCDCRRPPASHWNICCGWVSHFCASSALFNLKQGSSPFTVDCLIPPHEPLALLAAVCQKGNKDAIQVASGMDYVRTRKTASKRS